MWRRKKILSGVKLVCSCFGYVEFIIRFVRLRGCKDDDDDDAK
jgi:hypothetical protein